MATQRDYYEVLGVTRDASGGVIASAYRKLAVQYHPDKNPGDEEAIARFKEASEAFEILNDPNKRSRYDQFGHAGVNGGGGRGAGFNDVEDIFSAFGDIFGDIFGGRSQRARRGGDVRCDVTLSLHEAAEGCTKEVKFERYEPCDSCEGSGAAAGANREVCAYCGGHGRVVQSAGIVRVQTTCPSCNGAGATISKPCGGCRGRGIRLRKVVTEVRIPAGVDDGMRVRIAGEGERGPRGTVPGDCYCYIAVEPHRLFERQGPHLICRVPITYSQAALGCKLEVPTLDGRDEITIERGTQSGDVVKLAGQGMPDPHGRRRGDLLVQVAIEVPSRVSADEEALLRKLAELDHKNVAPKRKSFFESLKDYFTAAHAVDDEEDNQ